MRSMFLGVEKILNRFLLFGWFLLCSALLLYHFWKIPQERKKEKNTEKANGECAIISYGMLADNYKQTWRMVKHFFIIWIGHALKVIKQDFYFILDT